MSTKHDLGQMLPLILKMLISGLPPFSNSLESRRDRRMADDAGDAEMVHYETDDEDDVDTINTAKTRSFLSE